ncbi:MAG: FxLD family lanthipeptide [Streptosporangiaceae bacterium]
MDASEFRLNVRLVDAGPVASAIPSADCTSDGCGDTPGSAGLANC